MYRLTHKPSVFGETEFTTQSENLEELLAIRNAIADYDILLEKGGVLSDEDGNLSIIEIKEGNEWFDFDNDEIEKALTLIKNRNEGLWGKGTTQVKDENGNVVPPDVNGWHDIKYIPMNTNVYLCKEHDGDIPGNLFAPSVRLGVYLSLSFFRSMKKYLRPTEGYNEDDFPQIFLIDDMQFQERDNEGKTYVYSKINTEFIYHCSLEDSNFTHFRFPFEPPITEV